MIPVRSHVPNWRPYLLGGGLVLGFALTGSLSGSNHDSRDENKVTQGGHEGIEKQPKATPSADELVAHYTQWLAYSTGALVLVSAAQIGFLIRADKTGRLAAEAAKASADAAVAVELPILYAAPPELAGLDEPVEPYGPYSSVDIEDQINRRNLAVGRIKVRNYGRSYAIPSRVRFGWDVTPSLSGNPVYKQTTPEIAGNIIDGGGERELHVHIGINLAEKEVNLLSEGSARFWLYCSIEYLDFFRRPHHARFCWYWGCPDGVGLHYFVPGTDVPLQYVERT